MMTVFSKKFICTSARHILMSGAKWLESLAERIPSEFENDAFDEDNSADMHIDLDIDQAFQI